MTRLGRALSDGRLFRRPGSPRWVLDWTDGRGVRHREALSTDKRVAERMRAERIRQRDLEFAGLGSVEGQSRPLAELLPLYLLELRQRATASHVVNVEARLGFMIRFMHATRVPDVQATELTRYRAAQLALGKSNRTINCHVGALKAMLNWAVSAGLIAENPIRHFKPLRYGEADMRHVRRALSDEEIDAFLAAARTDDDDQAAYAAADLTIASGTKGAPYEERPRRQRVPQRLLWTALLETGARWSELTSTTWADLDRANLTLRLRATTTKSGKSRVIPLRHELADELWALRAIHQRVRQRMIQAGDRVFVTPEASDWPRETTGARRILHRVLDLAGIPRRTADGVLDIHALRHSAASRMARHGVPMIVTARVLGHASIELTAKVYSHLGVEDLRVAVVPSTRAPACTQSA